MKKKLDKRGDILTKIIGIISGKGGVGKTTFAANLAIALSNHGKRVVVVDCNITTPHLAYYLGAKNYSITLNNIFRNEVDVRFAPLCSEDVMFIPASEDLNDLRKVDINELRNYMKKLAKDGDYDYIILDSAPGLGREAVSVLEACEEIVFVTTPAIPNLADVTRVAEVASQMGHSKFHIVLNMVRNKPFELKIQGANGFFKAPILGTVPFDEDVMDSTSQGIPIFWYKPNSCVCDHYMEIAANLIGIRYEKPSIFRRISRKFNKLIGK